MQSQRSHAFCGRWITNREFATLPPRDVFHRQLEKPTLDTSEHRDRHILFRKSFSLTASELEGPLRLYISADDHYKLYLNGRFVGEGPAPSYHFAYRYETLDVGGYLKEGENLIAVHTLYQGLINRVNQSGDRRHGLILDLTAGGRTVLKSDDSFLCAVHTAYREIGTFGYDTGFLEEYDARAAEVGFERPGFDDRAWQHALLSEVADHTLCPQTTAPLTYERIEPKSITRGDGRISVDFGAMYVGRLHFSATGHPGDRITVRLSQETNADGSIPPRMRANCRFEEPMILGQGTCHADPYEYTAFRYAELLFPEGCSVSDIVLTARHYPFTLSTGLRSEYRDSDALARIFTLCRHTLCYGVQEAVLDCMEREKGFYIGDGCYTALAHALLSGDDAMIRKLIDDAFLSTAITPGMVTCLNCSFMQEIAEYPLMLVRLVLWHYRLTKDREYLAENYPRVTALLETYRRDYEREGLLCDLDKWCVVEWPMSYRDGYEADLTEGQICREPHVAISAYYLAAIEAANAMAAVLALSPYRDTAPLRDAFLSAFYRKDRHLFADTPTGEHTSMIGNVIPYGLGLSPDGDFDRAVLALFDERGITGVSLFGAFLLLEGLWRHGEGDRLRAALLDPGAWLRMLSEDATATFEGWGKDTKWNTSLFHLTMSYAAVFLADTDLTTLLG